MALSWSLGRDGVWWAEDRRAGSSRFDNERDEEENGWESPGGRAGASPRNLVLPKLHNAWHAAAPGSMSEVNKSEV